jgi:hypothetical protein
MRVAKTRASDVCKEPWAGASTPTYSRPYIETSGAQLLSDPGLLDKLHAEAVEQRPAVLFIDQADDVIATSPFVPQPDIAARLRSVLAGGDEHVSDVVLFAATDAIENVEPTLLRTGGFDEQIELAAPATAGAPATPAIPGRISALVTPTVTASIEGDDSATFVLDYEALKARTKVQSLSVTISNNGLLSAINSDAQDKTADVITNTASAVFSLGRAVALGIAPRPGGGQKEYQVAAPPEAKTFCPFYLKPRLDRKKALEASLTAEKQKDSKRTDKASDIADQKSQIASLRGDVSFYKDAGSASLLAEAKRKLYRAEEHLTQMSKDLDALGPSATAETQTKIAALKAQLTFTTTTSFVPTASVHVRKLGIDDAPEIKQTIFGAPTSRASRLASMTACLDTNSASNVGSRSTRFCCALCQASSFLHHSVTFCTPSSGLVITSYITRAISLSCAISAGETTWFFQIHPQSTNLLPLCPSTICESLAIEYVTTFAR